MAGSRGALALALALAGCASQPLDLLPAAERASAEGRLLQVLAYTDQIPEAHPGVERARELARDARMRLRRSVELAVSAIELQASWRDSEALAALAEAKRMWPDVPGLAARARLSRARMARVGDDPSSDLAWPTVPLAVLDPAPREEVVTPRVAAATPRAQSSLLTPPLGFASDESAAHDPTAESDAPSARRDEATAEIYALHQRALLRYGRGDLVLAAADWQRILVLQPDHAQATAMLQACWDEVLTRQMSSPAR